MVVFWGLVACDIVSLYHFVLCILFFAIYILEPIYIFTRKGYLVSLNDDDVDDAQKYFKFLSLFTIFFSISISFPYFFTVTLDIYPRETIIT